MKVLLLRPRYADVYSLFPWKLRLSEIRPPDNLLYIAGMVESRGHEVHVLDNEIECLPEDGVIKFAQERKFDVVGLGPTTPEYEKSIKAVKKLKDATGATVVFGGAHSTALPEEVLSENACVDYIVRGEGELGMADLLDALSGKFPMENVKGVSYRLNGTIIHNPNHHLLEDIDKFPYQARHLVLSRQYMFPFPNEGLRPTAVMMASRGCPHKCKFCFPMHGKKTRVRQPEKVAEEMEHVVTKYGIRRFIFHDESFGIDRDKFLQFCDLIQKAHMGVKWFCFTRADLIDDEFVSALKRAGCVKVSIGVESGDEFVLNAMGKGKILSRVSDACAILDRYGIETRGSFIIGLPFETHESAMATIQLAKRIKLKQIGCNICTPYPGTELYRMCMEKNGIELMSTDWSDYRRWGKAVVRTPELSNRELENYQVRMIADFYSRPSIIWYYIKQFLRGNRNFYYYRPLVFGLREKIVRMVTGLKFRGAEKIPHPRES